MVPEYRKEAKNRIVNAGLEVMYQKGYCRTTMDDIAKHLNVTKPALYRYFKNKNELILESAKILQGEYRRIQSPQKSNKCPIATWITVFDQMMSSESNEHALLLELIGMTKYEPEIGNYSIERMKIGIEESTKTIAEQQKMGYITSTTDPRTLAIALLSIFNGMRMMIILGVEHDELRIRWIEIIRALFLESGSDKFSEKCSLDCPGYAICTGFTDF